MADQTSNTVEVGFKVEGLKADLLVLRVTGQEELSRLFSFELYLAASSATLDLASPVGRAGVLTIDSSGGERSVHGMVRCFEQQESGRDHTVYRAVLVPRAWRLLQRQDCRIFQGKTVQQIVTTVLKPARVAVDFRLKGASKPQKREYCVQYRESDWAFVSRLLAEEGLYYFFEHAATNHTLVVGNDSQVYSTLSGATSVPFHKPDAMVPGEEQVSGFQLGEELRPGKVTLDDYNFETPSTNIAAAHDAGADSELELYDYPGMYEATAAGRQLARRRLEEARAGQRRGRGQSNCPRLTAGHVFTLSGHDRKDFNGHKYVLTRVEHRVEKSGQDLEGGALDARCSYDNSFDCTPAKAPFRPPRLPRPLVRGPQTAVVVGPSSEEIYTDKHGRVKVQFHWDRQGKKDDLSSCWVRVAQAWAGQGFGAMFLPRVGMEVVVDFLEGDPDRPLVTGCVYHAQNVPPLVLPGDKTKSVLRTSSSPGGKGFNEICLEDRAGAEEIFVHAQHDLREKVRHDMATTVDRCQSISVGSNRRRTVGNDELVKVSGDLEEEVKKGKKVTVGKNLEVEIKGAQSDKVHDKYEQQAKSVKVEAADSIELKCGGTSIKLSKSGNIEIKGSAFVTIQGRFIKLN